MGKGPIVRVIGSPKPGVWRILFCGTEKDLPEEWVPIEARRPGGEFLVNRFFGDRPILYVPPPPASPAITRANTFDVERCASVLGIPRDTLDHLIEILATDPKVGATLSAPTQSMVEQINRAGLVACPTDNEMRAITNALAELKEFYQSNHRTLRPLLAELEKQATKRAKAQRKNYDRILDDVLQTLKGEGWRLVERVTSTQHGVSTYLYYTTDGKPPDPDYYWGPRGRGSSDAFGYGDGFCEPEDEFEFDHRHCQVRVSDHQCGYTNIGLMIDVDGDQAVCRVRGRGKRHGFRAGEFADLFGTIRRAFG